MRAEKVGVPLQQLARVLVRRVGRAPRVPARRPRHTLRASLPSAGSGSRGGVLVPCGLVARSSSKRKKSRRGSVDASRRRDANCGVTVNAVAGGDSRPAWSRSAPPYGRAPSLGQATMRPFQCFCVRDRGPGRTVGPPQLRSAGPSRRAAGTRLHARPPRYRRGKCRVLLPPRDKPLPPAAAAVTHCLWDSCL